MERSTEEKAASPKPTHLVPPSPLKEASSVSGLAQLVENLRSLPRNLKQAVFRHGLPDSPRSRSQAVLSNLFLHVHSVRTHRWTLKRTFTLGLGVATLALFGILTVTGIMLMVYYKPTAAEAYQSIKDIHYVVPGGRLLRNTHRWAANLMIISVLLHMSRVFFTHSYQKPREFNWIVGIVLLVLTFALSFTGYCLPWDQLAYWAVVIGANIAGSPREVFEALGWTQLAGVGDLQRQILLGSRFVGDEAILRFYWLHCIGLPFLITMFIAVHFWRIRKDGGMSRPDDIQAEELEGTPVDEVARESFQELGKTYTLVCAVPDKTLHVDKDQENTVHSWPHAFRAELAVCMITLAFVLLLGIIFDAPLKVPADPIVPENPAKAPWYFLGLQEIVSYSAFTGGIALPGFLIACLALIPFLDREKSPTGRWPQRREARLIACSLLFAFVSIIAVLAFRVKFGWLRDWNPGINQLWIILVNPGTVLVAIFGLYTLGVIRQTASTRLGMAAFFCCFLVFFVVMTYFATVHRGPNWDFYWWPSQWPGH